MKQLKFEQLTEAQRAEAMDLLISLLQRGKIGLDTKSDAEHHIYGVNGTGLVEVRFAKTFSSGEAIAWEDPVSLYDGKPTEAQRMEPAAEPEPQSEPEGEEETPGFHVEWIDRYFLEAHPHNPRKHFDEAKLSELKANIERHGLTPALSHLLVRPIGQDRFQIISGERRWRATKAMPDEFWDKQAALAGMPQGERSMLLPCVVMEMTDNQALEMMHLANLDREDLTPLEEAESYRVMLELGQTIEQLAERLGRSPRTIRERLSLCSLVGTPVGEALEANKLPVTHAVILARLPKDAQAAMLARVQNPETGDGLMPKEMLKKIIATEVMVELRAADFDLEDAELVPLQMEGETRICGGACVVPANDKGDKLFTGVTYCPFNTFSDPEVESRQGKSAMCRNPKCYELKREAAHVRWMQGAAKEGVVPLGYAESARLFEPHNGKRLAYNSGFVELGDAPSEFDLSDDAPSPAPKWKTLVKDSGITVYLARDKSGDVHQIVNREVAIAAARDNGHDIFRVKKAAKVDAAPAEHVPAAQTIQKPRETDEQREKRLRDEARKLEAEKRVEVAFLREIFNKVTADKRPGIPLFEALIEPVVKLGPLMEESYFLAAAVAMGYDDKSHGREPQAVATWLQSHVGAVPPEHGLAVALLVASGVTIDDERAEWLKRTGKLLGVARKDVEKQVAAEMAEEDRKAAEEWEVENGMTWSDSRNKVEDFSWDAGNLAVDPSSCSLALPEAAKATACIHVARSNKGWHYGMEFTRSGKKATGLDCTSNSTACVERKLALTQGILVLMESIDASEKWGQVAINRLSKYVDKLQAPPAKDVPAKAAKKKGGK